MRAWSTHDTGSIPVLRTSCVSIKKNMKWVIFTGTWRLTSPQLEKDVKEKIRKIFSEGKGLVTGGATGADFFAMEEYFKLDPNCKNIRTFIPARLDHYIKDYHKNWCHEPVTHEDIDKLHNLLLKIKNANPAGFFEIRKEDGDITQDMYDARHDEQVAFSDELYSFRVNSSHGTSDTIRKAEKAGIKIMEMNEYKI
jgi:hypothetical protein